MKKRIYREWQEGDTGYYKGVKGKITIDNKTHTSFLIDWHSEHEKDYPDSKSFTIEGKFLTSDENPSLSFLPDEQSMPFDEVEEKENKNEESKTSYGNFVRFGFPHCCRHERVYITPECQKKVITNKINKIEAKMTKLNDKREKLLERYKSLGKWHTIEH